METVLLFCAENFQSQGILKLQDFKFSSTTWRSGQWQISKYLNLQELWLTKYKYRHDNQDMWSLWCVSHEVLNRTHDNLFLEILNTKIMMQCFRFSLRPVVIRKVQSNAEAKAYFGWSQSMKLENNPGKSESPNCLWIQRHFCEQHTSHVTFSRVSQNFFLNVTLTLAQVWCVARTSYMCHLHALMLCVARFSTTILSTLCCPSSLSSSFSFSCPSPSSSMWGTRTLRTLAIEDLGTFAKNDLLTGYEPNDFHISETTDIFIQESSGDNRSLNLHDPEFDDYTIGMALSSPLFTQEREDAASRRTSVSLSWRRFVVQSVVVCRSY